ncbi:hypothetical protein [Mesorhizobium sp.]|uniref:hypothetical protein n=1 Tax=Mesorhizobium sp. TaxID=1871066 RepID=UPI0012292354|nr:hypothetical protein [Mesorhizobium sp.]TIO72558.1 MAG: hypothetical protein E5X75_32110 [Mesorhizobium sp.]
MWGVPSAVWQIFQRGFEPVIPSDSQNVFAGAAGRQLRELLGTVAQAARSTRSGFIIDSSFFKEPATAPFHGGLFDGLPPKLIR